MPSLDKYKSQFLGEGIHIVQVGGYRTFTSNPPKSTPGVEFTMLDDVGRECKIGFYITEKALFRLANFAAACGLSDEDMAQYDTDVPANHNRLSGKKVAICYSKSPGDKYCDVQDFWPHTDDSRTQREVAAFASRPTSETTSQPAETVPDDDIPF